MVATELKKISLKKNDLVQVIAGRDKGKAGKIVSTDAVSGRVVVEKVNLVKRHLRPTQQNPQGGILEKETGIAVSNVLLMCPKCNRGVRHGHKTVEKAGKKGAKAKQVKVRVCKRCGESLDAV
jgi:large subunit ribosomal protein L24